MIYLPKKATKSPKNVASLSEDTSSTVMPIPMNPIIEPIVSPHDGTVGHPNLDPIRWVVYLLPKPLYFQSQIRKHLHYSNYHFSKFENLKSVCGSENKILSAH